jgi:hypothetical protein
MTFLYCRADNPPAFLTRRLSELDLKVQPSLARVRALLPVHIVIS